jgi:hypothetical protein
VTAGSASSKRSSNICTIEEIARCNQARIPNRSPR